MILAEITRSPGAIIFQDIEDEFLWEDSVDFVWGDMDRIANTDHSGEYQWNGYIMSISPIQFAIESAYGGYVHARFGSIEISPDFFDNDDYWPPPVNLGFTLYYSSSNDSSKVHILDGILHLESINREGISYDIHSGSIDQIELLDEIENYNGDIVPIPRAFGSVSFEVPVKLPDVGGNPTFHGSYIASPTFYDDGISIGFTSNGDGTFSLNSTPVGEVRISGTGAYSTVDEIAQFIGDRLNLAVDISLGTSPSPSVVFFESTQKMAVNFFSELTSFFGQLFYIKNSILYLVDMDTSNGSDSLGEWEFFPSSIINNVPVALVRSEWQDREAGQFRAPGGGAAAQCVRSIDRIASVTSSYPYGNEQNITPFHNDSDIIKTRLEWIMDICNRIRGSINIPLETVPLPGTLFTLTDNSLIRPITLSFYTRNIQIALDKEEIVMEGDGVIS